MYDDGVRIKKLTNGYSVRYREPDVVKSNREGSGLAKSGKPYRDPEREVAFTSVEDVVAFLKKNLDKICSVGDYDTSFDVAVMESKDDD